MNWIYLQLPHQIVFCPSFFTSLKQSPKWTVFWIIQCEYGEMSSWPLDIKNWRFWLATAWFSSLSFFRDPIDTAELLNRALPPSVSQWGYQRGEERGREREWEEGRGGGGEGGMEGENADFFFFCIQMWMTLRGSVPWLAYMMLWI